MSADCECSRWVVLTDERPPARLAAVTVDGHTETECGKQTSGTYAQGHDARLASLLRWAAASGHKASRDGGRPALAATLARRHLSAALAAKVAG